MCPRDDFSLLIIDARGRETTEIREGTTRISSNRESASVMRRKFKIRRVEKVFDDKNVDDDGCVDENFFSNHLW